MTLYRTIRSVRYNGSGLLPLRPSLSVTGEGKSRETFHKTRPSL